MDIFSISSRDPQEVNKGISSEIAPVILSTISADFKSSSTNFSRNPTKKSQTIFLEATSRVPSEVSHDIFQ